LIVNVVDVNDEAPRFSESDYWLSVGENVPNGTQVGRVVAHDADLAPNDRHTFTLDVTSQLADVFGIDALTGVIYTRQGLDREATDSYQLTALVTGTPHTYIPVPSLSRRRDRYDGDVKTVLPACGALIVEHIFDHQKTYNVNIHRVSEKNWTLCYFIIALLRQLRIA